MLHRYIRTYFKAPTIVKSHPGEFGLLPYTGLEVSISQILVMLSGWGEVCRCTFHLSRHLWVHLCDSLLTPPISEHFNARLVRHCTIVLFTLMLFFISSRIPLVCKVRQWNRSRSRHHWDGH